MTVKEFNEIYNKIKQPENYVKRPYQTIGGMWTVDTWATPEWRAQSMDEGYTHVLTNLATGDRYTQDYQNNIKKDKIKIKNT